MWEVYRARETKLGREVALKILSDLFASDSERVARFGREAKTLANFLRRVAAARAAGKQVI
jgi:serine/threonine protein kinase